MQDNSTLLNEISGVLTENGCIDRVNSLYNKKRNRKDRLITLGFREYWQMLFRTVLKENEYSYAFQNRQDLMNYINGLENLPDYALNLPEKIIEAERFYAFGEIRKNEILNIITAFHRLTTKISDDEPSFSELWESPELTLINTVGENDEAQWVCAQILHECGINIVSNRAITDRFAGIFQNPEIKTYRGWLRFLGEQTGIKQVGEEHRQIDYYLRFLDVSTNGQYPFTRLAFLDSFTDKIQKENDNTAKELLTGNIPDIESLTKYICQLIHSDLYVELSLHEPELIAGLPTHMLNGFKNVVATQLNSKLISYLKACYHLLNPGYSVAKTLDGGKPVTTHQRLYEVIANDIRHEKRENCLVVIMDVKHKVIFKNKASIGIVNNVNFDPRLIFGPAILLNAFAVAVAHNHPSGDPTPSAQDIVMTKKLNEIAAMLGFRMLDHLIIGTDSYFSMTANNVFQVMPDSETD